eukprot:scaffold172547_cov20-Tisochrysis_lutea.AAC.1
MVWCTAMPACVAWPGEADFSYPRTCQEREDIFLVVLASGGRTLLRGDKKGLQGTAASVCVLPACSLDPVRHWLLR